MKGYYFGVDVGGTEIKFGLFDDLQRLIDTHKVKTPKEDVRKEIVETIFNVVMEKLDEQEASLNALLGIGVAIPGPVIDGIISTCANLDIGTNFDIATKIKERFQKSHLKVVVGNDANLAAYGEYKYLNNNKIKDALFITLGTGIGGGVIINRQLVTGYTGSAGEIGHIPYDLNNKRLCGCGKFGCVETVAGTSGMIQTAEELMKKEKSVMEKQTITPKLIFDSAKAGDFVGIKVVDSVAKAIGEMAVAVSLVYDPEVIIIGGGVARAGEFLLSKINYHFQKEARFGTVNAKFEIAKLGNDAGFYGAYYLLLE